MSSRLPVFPRAVEWHNCLLGNISTVNWSLKVFAVGEMGLFLTHL